MSEAANARTTGPIRRAIEEALASFAAPALVRALLERALESANRTEVPEDPNVASGFVTGPLRRTVIAELGRDEAAMMLDSLGPILAMASSHVRESPAVAEAFEQVRRFPSDVSTLGGKAAAGHPQRAKVEEHEGTTNRLGVHDPAIERMMASATVRPTEDVDIEPLRTPPTSTEAPRSEASSGPERPANHRPEAITVRPPNAPDGLAELLRRELTDSAVQGRPISPEAAERSLRKSKRAETREPVVLMSTLDRAAVQSVSRRFMGRAIVRMVGDVFELVSALDAYVGAEAYVILDCCAPAVDPMSFGSLSAMLPPGVQIILWGASQGLREELESVLSESTRVTPCSADVSHRELAEVVDRLFTETG